MRKVMLRIRQARAGSGNGCMSWTPTTETVPPGGTVQATADSIDSENRCGPLEKRTPQRAQADRSQADYRNGAAERNVGALRCRPAGGQVVGEQQRLLGADRLGDLEQLEVGGGHGKQIGLCPVEHAAAEDLKAGVAHDRVAGGATGAGAAAGHR